MLFFCFQICIVTRYFSKTIIDLRDFQEICHSWVSMSDCSRSQLVYKFQKYTVTRYLLFQHIVCLKGCVPKLECKLLKIQLFHVTADIDM